MKLRYEREGSHRLFEQGNALVIEVLVGTSALYAVRLTLNGAEAAAFAQRGTAFIDELAAAIAADEPRYRAQGRTSPV